MASLGAFVTNRVVKRIVLINRNLPMPLEEFPVLHTTTDKAIICYIFPVTPCLQVDGHSAASYVRPNPPSNPTRHSHRRPAFAAGNFPLASEANFRYR
jgi:hypothetical protein